MTEIRFSAKGDALAIDQLNAYQVSKGVERTWTAELVVVHGNSKFSPRTAYLYELYNKDGTFLKNGITQNLDTRYSKTFMADKDIFPMASGTRAEMLILERERTLANPGPLNFESWAVKVKNARGAQ